MTDTPFASKSGIKLKAIRYGITHEEVSYAYLEGVSGDEAVRAIFYNASAKELVADIRAVLFAQGKETVSFDKIQTPGPDYDEKITSIEDFDISLNIEKAQVHVGINTVLKGGNFRVDLSLIPALEEAKEACCELEVALQASRANFAQKLEQFYSGDLKVEDVSDAPEEVADQEPSDTTSDADEEMAKSSDVDAGSDPEVEKPEEPVTPEASADEEFFGDEPDTAEDFSSKDVDLTGKDETVKPDVADDQSQETTASDSQEASKSEGAKPAMKIATGPKVGARPRIGGPRPSVPRMGR